MAKLAHFRISAFGYAALSAVLLGMSPGWGHADAGGTVVHPSTTYLTTPDIGYKPPPAPDNDSNAGKAELRAVIAAQPQTDVARQDAFEDAAAYNYDDLLPRFSVAAGTSLSLQRRPILAHMLKVVLADVYPLVKAVKDANTRKRPYKEDSKIIACETDYLPPSDSKSYPSNHAANGRAAALLLSAVMPEREPLIRARGIQYGDNRIVCGVHYRTDVEQGRAMSDAYFIKATANTQFQQDLACAKEEHQYSVAVRTGSRLPYSPTCAQLAGLYTVDAEAQVGAEIAQRRSFTPQ